MTPVHVSHVGSLAELGELPDLMNIDESAPVHLWLHTSSGLLVVVSGLVLSFKVPGQT